VQRYLIPVLCTAAAAVIVSADLARARPFETFALEAHDKIVAESPGCYAACTVMGTRRSCTVKESDCKVVCTELQECKPDGMRPIKVCAVVRERQ
jgi:hypothetical protein